ncbi:hypothetical protein [Lysobacter sp. D1-1-M9]|uniref:hypothetical protein n=1 Tax=Novilysobacter longmucuonensis TaxID=3098603 RepID=UPI002FC7061C
MSTAPTPDRAEQGASRLTPRPPGTPGDEASGYGDSNPVGRNAGDGGRSAASGDESTSDHQRRDRDDAKDPPIGSALASAGAGNGASSGSASLGATSGGERASAGPADGSRSSRDHRNSLED